MARESLLAAAWRLNRVFPGIIAALVLLNILVWVLLFAFSSPRVEALERSLITQQGELRRAQAEQGLSLSPQEILRQNREDLEKFREAIPEESRFTGLIEELYALTREAGLNIASISYDPTPIPESGLLQYGLSFSVEGDYGQIKKFIFSLEQSPRIIVIESISLRGAGAAAGQKVSMSIRLLTYFRLEESEEE